MSWRWVRWQAIAARFASSQWATSTLVVSAVSEVPNPSPTSDARGQGLAHLAQGLDVGRVQLVQWPAGGQLHDLVLEIPGQARPRAFMVAIRPSHRSRLNAV